MGNFYEIPYQYLITRLLACETTGDIELLYEFNTLRFDFSLLNFLKESCGSVPQENNKSKIDDIVFVTSHFVWRKYLTMFNNVANEYINFHETEFPFLSDYESVEKKISVFTDKLDNSIFQKSILETLQVQDNIRCTFAVILFTAAETWPEKRRWLIEGFSLLTQPVALELLNGLSDKAPEYKESVLANIELIETSNEKGIEEVLKREELNFLQSLVDDTEGELKIDILHDLIKDSINYNSHIWAKANLTLADTLLQASSSKDPNIIEEAIHCYQKSLLVYSLDLFPFEWAIAKTNLGLAFQKRISGPKEKNIECSITNIEQSLLFFNQSQHPINWAISQVNLGVAYQYRIQGELTSNLKQAVKAYQFSLLVFNQIEFSYEWAQIHTNLGAIYTIYPLGNKADNIEQAIKILKESLIFRTQDKFAYEWSTTYNNLGAAYWARIKGERADNIEEAIISFSNAIININQNLFPYEWAQINNNLGLAYTDRVREEKIDNIELAIKFYKQALTIFTRKLYPFEWAMVQNNLGNSYQNRLQGEYSENIDSAIKAYKYALKVRTKKNTPVDWATSQGNLALAYQKRVHGRSPENIEKSLKAYKEVLQVRVKDKFPYEWAITQNNLALGYWKRTQGDEKKNIKRAISLYKKSLSILQLELFPDAYRKSYFNLGLLYYYEKLWAKSTLAFEKSNQAIELLRNDTFKEESRRNIAKENAEMYGYLIHCYLMVKQTQKALSITLQSKNRILIDQLNANPKNFDELFLTEPHFAHDWSSIQEKKDEIDQLASLLIKGNADSSYLDDSLREQISQLRKLVKQQIDAFVFKYPMLAPFKALPVIENYELQILSEQFGNVPFVEYCKHTRGWGAFIITSKRIRYVPLSENIVETIQELLVLLGNGEFWDRGYRKRLIDLYKILFEPLQKFLPNSKSLIIAPTNELYLIPFQALITENGSYLSDLYVLSFVPSTTSLKVLSDLKNREGMNSERKLFSVAHSGNGDDFLPNVLLEAQSIRKYFNQTVSFYEEEAQLESILYGINVQSYEVIHFNGHARFDTEIPGNSGLDLADGKILSINDIRIRMQLKGNPLVTLNACQTGLTRPELGDEIIGLPWSFLVAGAKAVISSQWSVPDSSSRLLFEHFYMFRRQQSGNEALALQKAMKLVRSRNAYQNPYYWAAFQVIGISTTA